MCKPIIEKDFITTVPQSHIIEKYLNACFKSPKTVPSQMPLPFVVF